MAAVGVREEEQQARAMLRQRERMRRGRERQLRREAAARAKVRARYRAWLVEEKAAYMAHVQDPGNAKLTEKWLAVWRREPVVD